MEDNLSYDLEFNHSSSNELVQERLISIKDRKISKCLSDGDKGNAEHYENVCISKHFKEDGLRELSFYSERARHGGFNRDDFGEELQPILEEHSCEEMGLGIDQYINRDLWSHRDEQELVESTYLGGRLHLNEEIYERFNWDLQLGSEREAL